MRITPINNQNYKTNSKQSFGMAIRKIHMEGMTRNELDAIDKALPKLKEIAKEVDLEISSSFVSSERYSRSVFNVTASEPNKPWYKRMLTLGEYIKPDEPTSYHDYKDCADTISESLIKNAEAAKEKYLTQGTEIGKKKIQQFLDADKKHIWEISINATKKEGVYKPLTDVTTSPPRDVD